MITARRSTYLGTAVVAAMALALGACGGSSTPKGAAAKPPSPTNVLLASVQTTAATKSAHVKMSVTTSGTSGLGVSLAAEGDEDFTTGDSQLKMDLGGMMARFLPDGLEVRVVDHVAYVQLPGALSGLLGGGTDGKWLSIDESKMGSASNPFASVGQSDPTKFLAYLEKVSDDVKNVGSDTINGAEATHYHATIDLGKAVDQAKVPPALREKLKGLVQKAGAQAPVIPVDVWVDGQGRVVQIKLDMDVASFVGAAAGASGASGASGTRPTVSVTLNFSNFGEPVHVQAPPADQVIDLKDIAKSFGMNGGGFFGRPGGLGGTGGLGGSGGSSTGSLGTKVS